MPAVLSSWKGRLPHEQGPRAAGEVDDEALRNMHPLAALLQSLLPWFRMREAAAANGEAPPGRQHPLAAGLRDVDEADVARQQRATLEALRGHQGQALQARALAAPAAWPASACGKVAMRSQPVGVTR